MRKNGGRVAECIRVAELFAGVGGFRLGLEGYLNMQHPDFALPAAGPFRIVGANQWEPPGTARKQFAWSCYEQRFGAGSCVNRDMSVALDEAEVGLFELPDADMAVGGFPCQDYSVAKPLARAGGIEGEKGVLWWSIYRFLKLKRPRRCLFENVDRLLKSPAKQRGRDFAIILGCLASLGYAVEWRVVNAATYGFPQKRRRVFIYAEQQPYGQSDSWDLHERLRHGILARALPIHAPEAERPVEVSMDPHETTLTFNLGGKKSPFDVAGAMHAGHVLTAHVQENYSGPQMTLGDVLVPDAEVPDSYYVPEEQLDRWRYLKGAKREQRTAASGHEYTYIEGALAFPDPPDRPARTILTSEGGGGPSRSKHVVRTADGRYRRLVPDELEQLQGFPRGWTNTGMSDRQRAFCVGNALVVGLVHRIGQAIAEDR